MINLERLQDDQLARDAAVRKIQSRLEDADNPLLIVSGGSSVRVASKLFGDSMRLNTWTIAQVDERFGDVGHDASNWRMLQDHGLEEGNFKQTLPILSDGLNVEETTKVYAEQLKNAISECDVSIALIGIGSDGHIAGMLPMDRDEFEEKFQREALVTHFDGPDFQRITITQSALNSFDTVVAYSTGANKTYAIRKIDDDVPIHEHPAQLLKYVKDVNIYTTKE